MGVDGVRVWKRSSAWPLYWMVALGFLSLVLLASAFLPFLSDYALLSLLISIVGLLIAALGLRVWVAADWVRKVAARDRQDGKAVWPIRAPSESKGLVPGLLEVRRDGLEVRLNHGSASMGWEDLTAVAAIGPGIARAGRLVIDGNEFGRAELELLEANAFTGTSEREVREVIEMIKTLSASHH